jgi:transcriptional regulator with XRE-family HTH domain
MRVSVKSVADLGLLLRAVRTSQGLLLEDLAGCAKVGHVFVRDVEHGKDTVQMGRVFKLLDEIGISVHLDIPDDAVETWESLQRAGGLKPLTPRVKAGGSPSPTTP